MNFKNHDLTEYRDVAGIRYEEKPLKQADGLHSVWITLDNPKQLNSYTTEMVKNVILGMRRASNDRACVAVVFTGAGDRAFCTGGNTAEYAEYYSGRPEEYAQYMRLFNDMVSAILMCDKPVICRVNGMRIAGGQEIGMACDFTVAQDLAVFGQAGPRHGSAPDGGSTDFLPLFVGVEAGMESCTLCEHWSSHKARRLGLITQVVPGLKIDGKYVPNPLVETERWTDEFGNIVHGDFLTGDAKAAGKALLKQGTVDLTRLDEAVDALIAKLVMTFPGCLTKTILERSQAQARDLGCEQGDEPRMARVEHDDRSPHRVPRLPRRRPGLSRGGLHPTSEEAGRGRRLGAGAGRGVAGVCA